MENKDLTTEEILQASKNAPLNPFTPKAGTSFEPDFNWFKPQSGQEYKFVILPYRHNPNYYSFIHSLVHWDSTKKPHLCPRTFSDDKRKCKLCIAEEPMHRYYVPIVLENENTIRFWGISNKDANTIKTITSNDILSYSYKLFKATGSYATNNIVNVPLANPKENLDKYSDLIKAMPDIFMKLLRIRQEDVENTPSSEKNLGERAKEIVSKGGV